MTRQIHWLVIAIIALSAGVMFYMFSRQHGNVYHLPHGLAPYPLASGIVTLIGDFLPTFIHDYL